MSSVPPPAVERFELPSQQELDVEASTNTDLAMAALYSVFGLVLVCDRPLPRLTVAAELADDADVERVAVELGSVPFDLPSTQVEGWIPRSTSQIVDGRGEPVLRVWQKADGTIYRFLYSDATDFFVDREGRRIWVRWADPNTLEDTATYLLGPILGVVLRLHGIVSLHASAVVIDGAAIALAGRAGAGKSTTAAAFAQRGYPVMSDDISTLRPAGTDFLVQTDCPLLRLWPESSEILCGSRDALPRLSETWDKRFMDLEKHGYRAERRPRPLAAVYLLDGEPVSSDRAQLRELGGRDGFMALIANSYALILDTQMRADDFETMSQVIGTIPVKRVHKPTAGLTPLDLCDLLAADYRRDRGQSRRAARFETDK